MKPGVREGERGSGSVLVIGVVLVALTATLAVAGLSQAVQARHRAAAAADLGALAAAARVRSHGEDACAAARAVVEANDAELVDCRVEGVDVLVTAGVRLAGTARWLELPDPVRSARAGPGGPFPG